MQEVIEEIVKIAVNAPSGHNSQPWKFFAKERSVSIWNLSNKDKTPFNYEQRGSFIAHGALIENIVILASTHGYQADVRLFPEQQEPEFVADIHFKKTERRYPYENLSPYILKRATNRKPYTIVPLKDWDKKALETLYNPLKESNVSIALTQDRGTIHQVAGSLSMADRLIFENKHIHKALFSNVNWTLREEQEKREGLYVGTKELSPLERIVFKHFFRHWWIISKLRGSRLSTKAAKKRQKLYEHCSAIGLLTIPDDSPASVVGAGRALQKFWLTTTSLGLSFQPVSVGLLYVGQQAQQEESKKFTKDQIKFIRKAYQDVIDTFKISDKIPVFSFRIGYASTPTASSLKKEAAISKHMNTAPTQENDLSKVGVVFISPIIGLTPSTMSAFQPLIDQGIPVIGIDIFKAAYQKKTVWKILSLTMLPGANSRRISFANSFPEHKVFDAIENAMQQLIEQGKEHIVLGGMSGGFIFASRITQSPPDHEIEDHHVRRFKDYVVGLFGVSPLIFYPKEMKRPSAQLERIPSNIQTRLFFGDHDKIIPTKTIGYAVDMAKTHNSIRVKVLNQKEFGKPIPHQFFGGKDFVGPIKNPFWHPEAEKRVLEEISNFLSSIILVRKT